MNKTLRIFLLLGIGILGLALAIASVAIKTVQEGDTVTVNYTLTLDDGSVYYTTSGSNPIKETLGEGKFIPGFEEAVLGMRVGGSKTVTIPPEKAYGQYRNDLVGPVSLDRLPEDLQLVIGEQLEVELTDSTQVITVITDITESTVTLDANHPLAGQNLTFDIELVAVEKNQVLGGRLNQTTLSWAFLLLGGLLSGFTIFYVRKQGGVQRAREWAAHNLRRPEKRGWDALSPDSTIRKGDLESRDGLSKRGILIGKSWVTWLGILLVAVGTLFLGFAVVRVLAAKEAGVGDTVTVHYTLRLDDGTVYDTSARGEPLPFTLGDGKLLPGFEDALVGMRVRDSKTVRLPFEEAYGPYHHELVVEIDKSELPEGSQPVVGQQVQTTREDGTPLTVAITEVTETTVTLDANHPLAGQNLTFDVQLMGIEENQTWVALTSQAAFGWVLRVLVVIALGFAIYFLWKRRKLQQASE